MSTETKEALSVPQPEGEPIVLDDAYGAASQYQTVFKMLGGKRRQEPEVPPHLIANVVQGANGRRMDAKEVAQIARDLQVADEIVRKTPNTPIIYSLHCEEAVGITPDEGTSGFVVVNTSPSDGSAHFETSVPVKGSFRVRTGSGYEDDAQIEEDTNLQMYKPLTFLTGGDSEAVERFLDYRAEWMQYPNSHVVVGHEAVAGFLRTQAFKELLTPEAQEKSEVAKLTHSGLETLGVGIDTINNDRINVSGVHSSWAMLASAGLRKLGFDSPIGKGRDLVHLAGIRGVADIVANGIGYGPATIKLDGYRDNMVLHRLGGVEFELREDAQSAGRVAAELILSEKSASRKALMLHGDEEQLRSYLTDTAGNFIAHILGTTK